MKTVPYLILLGPILAALSGHSALANSSKRDMASSQMETARPYIIQKSMNVFRRFKPEVTHDMVAFYRDILGLTPLQPITLDAQQTIILFGIGGSQIKLAEGLQDNREYRPGAVNEATGIRYFTLFFPDGNALARRFEKAGYSAPRFSDIGNGKQAAFVRDPANFTLKLVVWPDAPAEQYGRLEIGINASDIAESRHFYRSFIGLDELKAFTDPLLETKVYPYRNGSTTITLFSLGRGLPADTGSAGMQYVVSDAAAVDTLGKRRGITVETPLGSLPNFDLTFVWLNDPDGVTNYFAQIGDGSATVGSSKD
ncbi:hypothetical protein D6851_14495 [Altericroceibacterium spongiae]|uniref:Glyoxalase/fosfomycin resistance/dioxygenase domain-containing protein n=1 Tax=Altericroceibacterium spongiae TaxID=2320269 RepID=A0A420ECC1_9SPHN|nr:VOC family protein [Altericroceibacterium spongiae]RKF18349.1 hypothetical protein D6851_14495 [Altericroceibacterium spongiae]